MSIILKGSEAFTEGFCSEQWYKPK